MTRYAIGIAGPIPEGELGITLPHEHLLIDMKVRYLPEAVDDIPDEPRPADRWKLMRNPAAYRTNLGATDIDETLEELRYFRESGGRTIVDLSPHGLARDADKLPMLAQRSGVNIIASTGAYVEPAWPDWMREASAEELAERFVRDLTEPDVAGIRRGAIGEVGIESGSEAEVRSVIASARAQARTGAPCFWHVMSGILPSTREQVRGLVDLYEREGGDPHALVLCHQDASGDDPAYQRSMLERGIWFAIDNFGFESVFAFDDGYLQNPTDTERIETVARLLDDGWGGQILLSQDICYRMMRRSWGGWGFAHILDTLVPRFAAVGIGQDRLLSLMRDNPARILSYSDGA